MRHFRTPFGIVALTALLAGGCATYQPEEPPQTGMIQPPQMTSGLPEFTVLDLNNDGLLERDEVSVEMLLNNWDAIDTNGDNYIDSSEFAAFESAL